jgi:hypothetical protein
MFHATLLRPYIKNEVYGNNHPRPLPELLEEEAKKYTKSKQYSNIDKEEEITNIT